MFIVRNIRNGIVSKYLVHFVRKFVNGIKIITLCEILGFKHTEHLHEEIHLDYFCLLMSIIVHYLHIDAIITQIFKHDHCDSLFSYV